MNKKTAIAAGILIAAGLAIMAVVFFLTGFDFSEISTEQYETKTFPINESFRDIEIHADESDIFFTESEDGSAGVIFTETEHVKHEVSVENGVLRISSKDHRNWTDHLLSFGTQSVSVTVCLPSAEYGALVIDSNTGDITVPAFPVFETLQITTDTGDVSCEASVSGPAAVKTNTGGIRAEKIRTEQLSLSVTTGDIFAEDMACKNELSVSVDTGRTELKNAACGSFVSTGSTGDLDLENVLVKKTLSVSRDTGEVRFDACDAGELTVRTSTGDVEGTLCSEKEFLVETSTGDVDVPETTSGGKCSITTSTGDIRIRISEAG